MHANNKYYSFPLYLFLYIFFVVFFVSVKHYLSVDFEHDEKGRGKGKLPKLVAVLTPEVWFMSLWFVVGTNTYGSIHWIICRIHIKHAINTNMARWTTSSVIFVSASCNFITTGCQLKISLSVCAINVFQVLARTANEIIFGIWNCLLARPKLLYEARTSWQVLNVQTG